MIHKYISLTAAYALFYIGVLLTWIHHQRDTKLWVEFWYPAQSWCMVTSASFDKWEVIWKRVRDESREIPNE